MRFLLVALLFAAFALASAQAAEDLNSILTRIYSSPLEAKGEADLLVGELEALVRGNMRSPAAPVIVHRINVLMPACADPTLVDDLFADLARVGKERGLPNGLLASDALIRHRRNLLRQGKFDEADTLKAFDSFAKKILVIGPFGFQASSLHDVVFPPEKNLEGLKSVQGFAGEVSWKLIERNDREAGFNITEHLYPKVGCTYALYPFRLAQSRGAILTLSTDASAKVWYNGVQVLDVDRRKAHLPGLYKIAVPAAKGWNRVFIKLSAGNSSFSLKITDRTGYPLADLVEIKEAVVEPLDMNAVGRIDEVDMGSIDMLALLTSHAGRHADNPFAALALADVLATKGLLSRAISEAERAAALAPDNAHILYFLGSLYNDADYLPRNYRTNRAKDLFKKVLEVDPEFLPARLAIAENEHENDRSEEAIESINKLLKKSPRFYLAWLTLAKMYDKLDWQKEFLDAVREARKLGPRDTRPLVQLARYYRSIDRDDLAMKHYQKALDLDSSRLDILERVADYLWNQGELVNAYGLFEKTMTLDDSVYNRERLAALQRALGDPVKAQEIYTELSAREPLNPQFYTKLGHLAFELRDEDAAAKWYQKALDVSPQEHALREILRDWKKLGDPLFDQYAADEAAYTRDLPGKEKFPKASAICSLDHMISRVYPDGSMKSEIFQIYKILDKDAVEELGRISVPGRLEDLKVIKPDGRILEPVDAEGRGVFNMPGLDVDALLVRRHKIYENAAEGTPLRMGRFFFQDVRGTTPFLFSQYVLSIPKGFDIHLDRTLPDAFDEERIDGESETTYVFTARDMDVTEAESFMPPEEEAFPNVDLYQSRDWVQVSQRMANGRFPDLLVTEEVRKKAEEVTEGKESDLDKAETIYAFVNDLVREDRGFSNATSVMIEGQGDRAALFMALCDASGIGYDCLRCGYRPGYLSTPPNWSDVMGSLLPNELVRLKPEGHEPVLLSFDSRLTPFGEIPPYLFSAPAMKLSGRPELIETLPGGDPLTWLEEKVNLNIKVDSLDGLIKGTLVLPGFNRTRFREQMQRMDAHSRRTFFEYRVLRGVYPGAEVKKLEILGIDDEESPPTFAFTLEAKDFIHAIGDSDGMKLLPVPMNLTRGFIRKPERTFPMIRRGYTTLKTVLNVDLNEEFTVVTIPDSLVERRFFLNYALVVSETGKGVRVERTVDFMPADVEPDQYPELIEMLKTIDEREVEPILLKHAGSSMPKTAAPRAGAVKSRAKTEEGSEKAGAEPVKKEP
jgi:tetratricopeptide (TPR) repeat protein